MVIDETFRRVSQVHESGRSPVDRPSRGDATTRSGVPKTGRSESQQTRPETRHKKKAERSYVAFRRPRGFRLEYSFRSFCPLRRQFCISQSLANDLRTQQTESVSVIQGIVLRRPVVVAKNLFVDVAVKVERFHCDIRALQSALEQTPKVFD